ncbi:DUF397 domain-containing protein [Streptomyces sp. NPDC052052]|uniref:DUF397 domain-containing protein n=1 Tax=Streptomyces sp. NPDC052052 TaxID=3154756 RepID=UPI00341948C9
MSGLHWVKSSFSDAGGNNCLELASPADEGGVALRESDSPGNVLVTDRDAIRALLLSIKSRCDQGPQEPLTRPVAQLDTVQLDTSFGGHFIDAPTPLGNYRSLLDLMEESALPPDESRDLIRSIAREL